MELKDITKDGEVLILWRWEVNPEEAAAGEQTLEIVPDEVQFTNLFCMDDMTGRGSRDRLIALSIVRVPTRPLRRAYPSSGRRPSA
jgi:hypothetical protein